jgi:hypothetical protein
MITKKELEIRYAKAKVNFRKSYKLKPKEIEGMTQYWSGVCNTYRLILNEEYGKDKWDDKLYYKLYKNTYK